MIVDCLLLIAVVVVVVVVAVCVFFFVIAGKHASGDDVKNDNVSGGNLSPFVHIKTCDCCRLLLLLLLFVSSFCHLFAIAGKHVSCDDAKTGNVSGGNISPFVHIKTVQVQGKWVSKGRLKFSRTYRKKTKRFNIRYPFA